MRILVVLAFAWCCSAQFVVPYSNLAAGYPWAVKYSGSDAFGQTTFGHHAIDQTRHEVHLAGGRRVGQFSYIDTKGEPAVTYFEAGPNTGYRVLGSNILPEAPKADLVAPEQVDYSPDVAAARAEFFKEFEKATAGEQSRKKRHVTVPLPYLHAVPTETEHTVETKQFEPVDAATPADTTKLQLTTKEHVFKVPSIKYVRPVVNVKQYTAAVSPAGVSPYYGSFPYHPFAFSGLRYPTLLTPAVKKE